MSKITEYKLHDLKENVIHGPFDGPDEVFQAVADMSMHEPYFIITKVEVETSMFDYGHAMTMWLHKQKSKKTKDVDAEIIKTDAIVIETGLVR